VDIEKLAAGKAFELHNPKNKTPGTLLVASLTKIYKPSFLDFLKGGLQLNMMVAIDFTESNKIPTDPNSLHHISEGQQNQYQKAINSIGEVLMQYDYDKKIPAFGFGAVPTFISPNHPVSHCFPLSGNNKSLEANGVEGLLEMYKDVMNKVTFAGPTLFAPLLK